jgi:hypothetical protein
MAIVQFQSAGHKPGMRKQLWNMLRITLFMIKRGVVKQHKILQDFHVMMKKGKTLGKNLAGSLRFHHNSKSSNSFGRRDYEFSCSSSPARPSFHFTRRRQLHHYFTDIALPCIHPHSCQGEELREMSDWSKRHSAFLQWDYNINEYTTRDNLEASDFPQNEEPSCISVDEWMESSEDQEWMQELVPDYSSRCASAHEEADIHEQVEVDRLAEEFISRFYNEIKLQRQSSLIQYQEMLARGTD